MKEKLEQIKHQARNADKNDLRNVVEHLTDTVLEMYKIFNAKIPKEVPKKTSKSTKQTKKS